MRIRPRGVDAVDCGPKVGNYSGRRSRARSGAPTNVHSTARVPTSHHYHRRASPAGVIRSFDGTEPDIHDSAYIDPAAVVIGDVTLAAEASVWPNVTLRGDHGRGVDVGAVVDVGFRAVEAPYHTGRRRPTVITVAGRNPGG